MAMAATSEKPRWPPPRFEKRENRISCQQASNISRWSDPVSILFGRTECVRPVARNVEGVAKSLKPGLTRGAAEKLTKRRGRIASGGRCVANHNGDGPIDWF